jgi:hypothetical protein
MRKAVFFLTFFFISLNSYARYTQTCSVKYWTQEGWSKKYTVDVTFMSGFELNDATNSLRYYAYSTYAIIFWGNDKATVIKISSFTGCGFEVDKDCIANNIYDLKGKDQDDDEWKICVSSYCY